MTGATATWRGRRGAVLLGETEDRVARYLADATRDGWIRIRTVDLAARLGLCRSEAYRILARLRVLGLFGVSSDQGGTTGGRRIWRTATRHDGPGLDPARHRSAWGRTLAGARAIRAKLLDHTSRRSPGLPPLGSRRADPGPLASPLADGGAGGSRQMEAATGGRPGLPSDQAGPSFDLRVWGADGPPAWWAALAPGRSRR